MFINKNESIILIHFLLLYIIDSHQLFHILNVDIMSKTIDVILTECTLTNVKRIITKLINNQLEQNNY